MADTGEDRYVDLRNEHHHRIMGQLQEAETELTTEANADLKSDYRQLEGLANRWAQLYAPLSDEDAEYSARGADGRYRTVSVSIKEAVAAFEKRLESTAASLDELWATWDEARAKIESLGADLLPNSPESGNSGGRDGKGDPEWNRLMSEIEASTSDSNTQLQAELDGLTKEAVEEFRQQEKVGETARYLVCFAMFRP